MTDQPKLNDDLFELAWLACDGTATDEQLTRLSARLDADPESLQYYVRYVAMHADLEWDYVGKAVLPTDMPLIENSGVSASSARSTAALLASGSLSSFTGDAPSLDHAVPSNGLSNTQAFWFGIRWPALISLLLLVAIVGAGGAEVWFLFRGSEPRIVSERVVAVTPVAYLTSNTACAWGSDSRQLHTVGHSVGLGEEIALLEGIAEFRLSSGVYINIEGPAGLVLTSSGSVFLQYGKMIVTVPATVTNFKVSAGACKLSAYDAEFGVYIAGNRISVHTFSGEVTAASIPIFEDLVTADEFEYSSPTHKRNVFTKAVITKGRALSLLQDVNAMKVWRWADASPSLFAAKIPMAGPLPVDQSYVDAVLASKPLGYWRFESIVNGTIANEISSDYGLRFVGALQLSGPRENRAADFFPSGEGYLICNQTLNVLAKSDYSVELWAKPSHVHRGGLVALLASDTRNREERHAFCMELIGRPAYPKNTQNSTATGGRVRVLHRDPPQRRFQAGTNCYSGIQYDLRRWQHITAVKTGSTLQLYINGILTAEERDKSSLAKALTLIVGRTERASLGYSFSGLLDELAIYNRALSKDEIASHYKLVQWTSSRQLTPNEL